jgi:hypothetical protein
VSLKQNIDRPINQQRQNIGLYYFIISGLTFGLLNAIKGIKDIKDINIETKIGPKNQIIVITS